VLNSLPFDFSVAMTHACSEITCSVHSPPLPSFYGYSLSLAVLRRTSWWQECGQIDCIASSIW
jgi:hypothetical protein